jgi:hypothetical protein
MVICLLSQNILRTSYDYYFGRGALSQKGLGVFVLDLLNSAQLEVVVHCPTKASIKTNNPFCDKVLLPK